MLKLQIRPIERWPGERTKDPRRSQFDSTYKQTLDLLERELDALNARTPILQLALRESDINRDGSLRASTKVAHPGLILSFEVWKPNGKRNAEGQPLGRYTPLSFPCDAFDFWQDNLRAIALGLEALRKLNRYGITNRGEQYTGWLALPAKGELQSDSEAAAVLMNYAKLDCSTAEILLSPETAKRAYRAASFATHVDTRNGDYSDSDFGKVQTAWGRLKERHKIA